MCGGMSRRRKEKIIDRLMSPFSYVSVTVPERVYIDGKEVNLGAIVDKFEEREATGRLTRNDILFGATLSRILEKEILRIVDGIERGEIRIEEAEKNLDTWLGMVRASKLLRARRRVTERDLEKDGRVAYVRWFSDPELFESRWCRLAGLTRLPPRKN